jgi:hypothetical protein
MHVFEMCDGCVPNLSFYFIPVITFSPKYNLRRYRNNKMNTSLLQQYVYWNVGRNEPVTRMVQGGGGPDDSIDVQIQVIDAYR